MIERHLSCLGPSGFHLLVYSQWPGPAGARTLVCVHGLTRNAKDFDAIAEALAAHYRVICPDMPGRGRSDNLAASAEYSYPLYVADAAALLARLDVENVDWLGTSMGGPPSDSTWAVRSNLRPSADRRLRVDLRRSPR